MEETIYYIKRVVVRDIQAIRAKGDQLKEYQKSVIDENKPLQEWEHILIEDCKTVEMLRFRCKIDGAIKLIPELTFEKIQNPGSSYIIS